MESKKYFIGFVLPLEADQYARMIANDLFETFGIKNQFKKYPPHVTMKISFTGFESDKKRIISFLEKFIKGRAPVPVKIGEIHHFNMGVIYLDILDYSEGLITMRRELCDGLQSAMPGIGFGSFEPEGSAHATLAEGDIKGRFMPLYEHVKKYQNDERIVLSKLHLFEKLAHAYEWKVTAVFPLKSSF